MKRQEAIDKLVNAVKERPYGDVLTFDSIGYIIDQKHGSVSYGDILQAAMAGASVEIHMLETSKNPLLAAK